MERLTVAMSDLRLGRKRTFVDAFLEKEASEDNRSKRNTRIELARAKNRVDLTYQNMLKTKERLKAMIEKCRELEASHEAAKAEVERLKKLLQEDD